VCVCVCVRERERERERSISPSSVLTQSYLEFQFEPLSRATHEAMIQKPSVAKGFFGCVLCAASFGGSRWVLLTSLGAPEAQIRAGEL
jgi:hypothetical protein